jgi:hypothetical protein
VRASDLICTSLPYVRIMLNLLYRFNAEGAIFAAVDSCRGTYLVAAVHFPVIVATGADGGLDFVGMAARQPA